MEFKGNEVKAGIIIIAAVLALGIFLVAMFGVRFSSVSQATFTTESQHDGAAQG